MAGCIDLGTQFGKDLRKILDFVQDHKMLAVAREVDTGLSQRCPVRRPLEVEHNGSPAFRRDGTCQGRLPHLARADEDDAREDVEPVAQDLS